jgi:hypothetical protein
MNTTYTEIRPAGTAVVTATETNTGAIQLELQLDGNTLDEINITPIMVRALRAHFEKNGSNA